MIKAFPALAAREDWAVVTQPLTMVSRVVGHETVLKAPVLEAVNLPGMVVFRSGRRLWIKRTGKAVEPLNPEPALPALLDWYTKLCPAGNLLVIPMASYPEAQRQKDQSAPRGEIVEGPAPLGMLMVDVSAETPRFELVPRFKVRNRLSPTVKAGAAAGAGQAARYNPATLMPAVQGCQWDGAHLVVSGYGFLARLDLKRHEAELLEYDPDPMRNREALYLDGEALWFVEDEGGVLSGCLVRREEARRERICLLNRFNAEVGPSGFLRHVGRMFSASLAGVVEIDPARRRFVHYPLHADPRQMRVFGLRTLAGGLWAVREDGWVTLNLEAQKAVLYQMRGVSNNVYLLVAAKDGWYVATDEAVHRISPSGSVPAGGGPPGAPDIPIAAPEIAPATVTSPELAPAQGADPAESR